MPAALLMPVRVTKATVANFHKVKCQGNGCGLTFACQTDHRKRDCTVRLCFRCDPEEQAARAECEGDRRRGR